MDQTSNLKLPYIAPSLAQKHVTHDEAIQALDDALVQLAVVSREMNVPLLDPQEGERYREHRKRRKLHRMSIQGEDIKRFLSSPDRSSTTKVSPAAAHGS
jgi:hypothetical protein